MLRNLGLVFSEKTKLELWNFENPPFYSQQVLKTVWVEWPWSATLCSPFGDSLFRWCCLCFVVSVLFTENHRRAKSLEPEVPATTRLFCTELRRQRPFPLFERRAARKTVHVAPGIRQLGSRQTTEADVLELQPALDAVGPHVPTN